MLFLDILVIWKKQDEQLILHFYSEQTEVNTTDYSKQWECNFQVNEITCIDALHQNTNTNHNQGIVTLDKLKLAWKNDIPYEKLITSVRSGFP